MTPALSAGGTPRLQRTWDSRAACNFIGGGSGTGLLLVAAAAALTGWPYFPAAVLAIALIGFGLSMVWLEIGRPLRALNVFFHPQTSWMTREAFLALPIFALGSLAVLLDQDLVPLPLHPRGAVSILAIAAAILGLAFLYCQARILHASHGVPAWREPSLQSVIVVTGIAEGFGLFIFLASIVGPLPVWVVPASIAALVIRAGGWERYRRRIRLTASPQAIAVLNQASLPVHLLGHVLTGILFGIALTIESPMVLAAVAGLLLFVTGAWLKFVVVTRASFTRGFSLPFMPVRGGTGSALPIAGA